MLPLRDLFTSLFFVSVGMLIDPSALLAQVGLVVLVAGVATVGKVSIVTLVVLLLGMPGRVALLAGLSIAQVGEFSFVLARIGVDGGAIPHELFDLTLATALVTIIATPFLLRTAPALLAGLERLPVVGARFGAPLDATRPLKASRRHVVICGFGRVGSELAAALTRRGLGHLVIEYNPVIVRELRDAVLRSCTGMPPILQCRNMPSSRGPGSWQY